MTCYSWAPSSGDHLFTCGAISRPPQYILDAATSNQMVWVLSAMNWWIPISTCFSFSCKFNWKQWRAQVCWVRIAISSWNIFGLRNTVKSEFGDWENESRRRVWSSVSLIEYNCDSNEHRETKVLQQNILSSNTRSWNKRRTKSLSSTGVHIVKCLHLNVVDIHFVSDSWIVLGMRVTHSSGEIIRVSKLLWFNNNILN